MLYQLSYTPAGSLEAAGISDEAAAAQGATAAKRTVTPNEVQ
jgi:hypothetical protein